MLSPHPLLEAVAAGQVAVEVQDDDGGETLAHPVCLVKTVEQFFPFLCRVRDQNAEAGKDIPVCLGKVIGFNSLYCFLWNAQHSGAPGGIKDQMAGRIGGGENFQVVRKAHV